ncbi:MAG: divergent polysaccharide deacetylase family protein, partial [Hoeflea sp.]|nr:divergent polysaccharide deacetylase family protein [Hoeflea sp.]
MASLGTYLRLMRAGFILVREGVISSLPADELPAPAKFGLRVAGLLARRKARTAERTDRLARAVERLGPSWVKLGQFLATRPDVVGAEIADDSPLARNARAFSNPDGKPTVSLIVSGLGTNATRTRAAIDELPPEVTLSFAPTSDNLSTWVRRARRAGHEVLI